MDRTRFLALALVCVAPASLPAQTQPRFAPARLARIDRFMQQYVDSGQIGGAVGLVLEDGRVVYQHAVGWLDKESGRRLTTDALFRIASQTDRKSTRLNSSHLVISYAVFCLKKKKKNNNIH